mgnify:CR=1 FL=1
MAERRGRLFRSGLAGGCLGLLLALQPDLLALTPARYRVPARLLVLLGAGALGSAAIREAIPAIFARRQSAMVWRNVSIWTLYGLLALLIASAVGVNLSGLLVGGAILGVVVASVSQASLGNLFAGMILMLGRPYQVGDTVRLRGSSLLSGIDIEGLVVDLGALHTTLLSSTGETMKLPNNAVISSAMVIGEAPLRAEVELRLPPSLAPSVVEAKVRDALPEQRVTVRLEPKAVKAEGGLTYRLLVRSGQPVDPTALSEALRSEELAATA